jgi:2-polyprenyl-3-methyl-5-hydroxy-6-metoxy-1,4-benzoquinol methylase
LTDLDRTNAAFFGELFADAKLDTKVERSAAEAEFILSLLRSRGIADPPRVLDLGCGRGRVAIELALKGAAVTGIDINQDYLSEAEKRARGRGAEVRWRRCDDRELGADGEYDAVISLYTTFGYHDDNGNERVLFNISHALAPSGLFTVELHNRDHSFIFSGEPALDYTGCNEEVLKDYSFDP